MADEYIKVGQTFTVTLSTSPLITLDEYSGHLIYYKRPDGVTGTITPDSVSATAMIGTVSTTLNPLTVSGGPSKWANGYAGAWEFYPYCIGSGGAVFRGQEDVLIVHPQWRIAP